MCDEVTEIQCDVVPYTECAMEMEETPYKSYDMENQIFRRKSCTEGMDVVQHTKMMPECRNVTKQNCITKWETDDEGNQVRQKDIGGQPWQAAAAEGPEGRSTLSMVYKECMIWKTRSIPNFFSEF